MEPRFFIRTKWREVSAEEFKRVAENAGAQHTDPEPGCHTYTWQSKDSQGVAFYPQQGQVGADLGHRIVEHLYGADTAAFMHHLGIAFEDI